MDINSFLSSFAEGTTTAEDRLRSDLKGVGEKLGEQVLAPYLIDAISRVSYFAVSRDNVGATVTLKLDAKPTEKAEAEPVSAADQRAADLADEASASLDRLKIGTASIVNDHPISLRGDLDSFARGFAASLLKQKEDGLGEDRKVNVPLGLQLPEGIVALNEDDARNLRTLGEFLKLSKQRRSVHDDSSTDAARAGIPDAAPTVEADTPTRAGIGVEDATTPAPSTSDDIVSVSISLSGDRELVERLAALLLGGAA